MNCKDVENKLIFYLENECDTRNAELIREHLNTCKSCRSKYEYLKETFAYIDEQTADQVNPFIKTRIMSKIHANKRSVIIAKTLSAVAFAALLIVAVLAGKLVADFYLNSSVSNIENVVSTGNPDDFEQYVFYNQDFSEYYFYNE